MTIAGKPIYGVKWYVKFVSRHIRCIYIDITDIPDWLKFAQSIADDPALYVNDMNFTFTFSDMFNLLSAHTGGGVTYEAWGIQENGYKTIEPFHKFLGWDYGHDVDIILGKKSPPTVAEIESHVKFTVEKIKNAPFEKRGHKWVKYFIDGE